MRVAIYIAISANGQISNSRGVPDWLSPEYSSGFFEKGSGVLCLARPG